MRNLSLKIYPFNDELLSSWIARYSWSYGLTPYMFLQYKFNCMHFTNIDYSRHLSEENLTKLSFGSDISKESLLNNTLFQYGKSVLDSTGLENSYRCRDIIAAPKIGFNRLCYCPICLMQDKSPYYRMDWRFTINVGCIKHKVQLRNVCPHCNSPILLNYFKPYQKNIGHCWNCWQNIANVKSINLDCDLLWLLKIFKESLNTGWVTFNNFQPVFAPLFYKGIWNIINVFYSKKKNINYLLKACEYFNVECNEIVLAPKLQWLIFQKEPIEARIFILNIVAKLLNDWPNTWINFCEFSGITRSVLKTHVNDYVLPYWLYVISMKELNKFSYRSNTDEITSILKYMLRNKIKISKGKLARYLGVDESMKLSKPKYMILKEYQLIQNKN